MSFSVSYQNTMSEVANLAMNKQEPGYVRIRALVALVRELSPLNDRHQDVERALGLSEESSESFRDLGAESRGYMNGFSDGLAAAEKEAEAAEEDVPL